MSQGIQRSVFRWIHILVSIPIYGYIYSPFDKLPQYAPCWNSVCLLSDHGPFRIVDVERSGPSTTTFEKIGLASGLK